jgi:hypothetical protein
MPQNQRRGNQNRNQTRRYPRNRANNGEPGTPQPTAPRFLAARNRQSPTSVSASPATPAIRITEPVVPTIQQSQPREPLYLAVATQPNPELLSQPHGYTYHVPTSTPVVEWRRQPVDDRSEPELIHRTPLAATTLYSYYPEDLYLSSVLPTRNPAEIGEFLSHCRAEYNESSGQETIHYHNLTDVRQITTSVLHFQNLLLRHRIIINGAGVIEEYARIKRQNRANALDKAYLEPAYKVQYKWNQNGWTVSHLTPRI